MKQASYTSSSELKWIDFGKIIIWLTLVAVLVLTIFNLKFNYEWLLAPKNSGFLGLKELNPDILFIGSSHTKQGVDSKRIEDLTKLKVFNLNFNGLDPISQKLVFEETLNLLHDKPKIIFLESYALSAARESQLFDTKLYQYAPPNLKEKILQTIVYTNNTYDNWQQWFELNFSNGSYYMLFFPIVRHILDSYSYHGSYKNKFTKGSTSDEFANFREHALSTKADQLALNYSQANALKEIVNSAKDFQLNLVFFETPMPKAVMELESLQTIMKELQNLVQSSGFTYLNHGMHKLFPIDNPDYFMDWNHLSSDGRSLYSEILAKEIINFSANNDLK